MPVLTLKELSQRLNKLFMARGLDEIETHRLVDILVATEAAGRTSHGLIRVRPMLRYLEHHGHTPGVWLRETAAGALYDGRQGLGYLVAWHTTQKAIDLAKKSGLAFAGAKGATHTGPLGYFVEMCARQGLVGIAFANCFPLAAPFGGASPVLGTNPVAFGFPRREDPLIVDFGTTAVTYGECLMALSEEREIPEGVALDSSGNPTRDPNAAMKGGAFLPFGGHKGYALALAVQVITTALIGSAAIPEPGQDYGFSVLALKHDLLVNPDDYERRIEELIAAVQAVRPVNPERPVRLPGDNTLARRREAEAKGIDIPDKLFKEIFG